MEIIQASEAQKESLSAARQEFERKQREEEEQQRQAAEARRKAEAENQLRLNAVHLAGQVATHQVFVGNREGAPAELLSDWATVSFDEDDDVAFQALVRQWVPEDSHSAHRVRIDTRLKHVESGAVSTSETRVSFDLVKSEITLHKEGQTEIVRVDTPQYTEIAELLSRLETAKYETN